MTSSSETPPSKIFKLSLVGSPRLSRPIPTGSINADMKIWKQSMKSQLVFGSQGYGTTCSALRLTPCPSSIIHPYPWSSHASPRAPPGKCVMSSEQVYSSHVSPYPTRSAHVQSPTKDNHIPYPHSPSPSPFTCSRSKHPSRTHPSAPACSCSRRSRP